MNFTAFICSYSVMVQNLFKTESIFESSVFICHTTIFENIFLKCCIQESPNFEIGLHENLYDPEKKIVLKSSGQRLSKIQNLKKYLDIYLKFV